VIRKTENAPDIVARDHPKAFSNSRKNIPNVNNTPT